ncbi:MAG: hypothetical protein R3F43_33125 [bacterium]
MELLVACGAPPSILYEARPHRHQRLQGGAGLLGNCVAAAGVDVGSARG